MRFAHLARAFVGASLTVVVAVTAGAQSARPPLRVPALSPSPRAMVSADDDQFVLDDTLLAGVALTDAQRADVAQLRKLQLAEEEGGREEFMNAVDLMHQAHDRGDDGTASTIMAVLQAGMKSQQTWRLAALRALLTPQQRVRFDANVDELMAGERAAAEAGEPPA